MRPSGTRSEGGRHLGYAHLLLAWTGAELARANWAVALAIAPLMIIA